MKKFAGSSERLNANVDIEEQTDPNSEDFNPSLSGGRKEINDLRTAQEELKKGIMTYFSIFAEGDKYLNTDEQNNVAQRCRIILEIISTIEKRYRLHRNDLLIILGKVCREGVVNIGRHSQITDDKTLGEAVFSDIVRRINGHNESGVS